MTEELNLRNYTEILVETALRKMWNETDNICKCTRCYYDTMALALNHLPSKYVVTQSGEVYAKINNFINQTQVDVMYAVMKASMKVNENYSHPLEEVVYESNK